MSIPRLIDYKLGIGDTFRKNGFGFLVDAISCVVSETVNKIPKLRLEYPVLGNHAEELNAGRYIVCKPNDLDGEQAFVITKVTNNEFGTVSVNAEHCARQTKESMVAGFNSSDSKTFIESMKTNALNNFCEISTDVEIQNSYIGRNEPPRTVWASLTDGDRSFIGLYGGEIKFDNFSVSVLKSKGRNRGLVLQQSVNVSNMTKTTEYISPSAHVYPFWYSEGNGGYVELPERIIPPISDEYLGSVEKLDLTFEFEEKPTQDQLRDRALYWVPQKTKSNIFENITVDFLDVSNGGKNKIPVYIGDIVRVNSQKLRLSGQYLKIVSLDYDVLSNSVKKIGLGQPIADFADLITSISRR